MARIPVDVTYRVPNPSLLPPWASMPIVLLEELGRRGLLDEVESRIKIERKAGGHGTVEVLAFLVTYFASGLKCGLRPFWEKMKDWGRARGRGSHPSVQSQLAGLVGKTDMCSSSSLSRTLAVVNALSTRASYEWLLIDVPDLLPLLRHPAVLMRDTFGRGYHVFDMDPSVTGVLERGLAPSTEDLRAGERLALDLAEPGYAGRKRADTQFIRAVVSHAGLGAWVYSQIAPGNGDARGDLAAALNAIKSLLARLEAPVEYSITRLDGAYGGVPAMTALIERGMPFVTRAAQQIMTLPEVQVRLSIATWEFVPGAEIDGMRSVAELGTITLEAADGTLRDDGSSYVPVTVRAVVTRIRQGGEAGRGVVIEGWQYEVFLTMLEPDAWPAAEVVSAYHGRSTCENRYAQEDRELELDRVFNYQPGGQELATVVGMMVWNMQIVHGFRLSPPPVEEPPTRPRVAALDERTSTFSALEEAPPAQAPAAPADTSLDDLSSIDAMLDDLPDVDVSLDMPSTDVSPAVVPHELMPTDMPQGEAVFTDAPQGEAVFTDTQQGGVPRTDEPPPESQPASAEAQAMLRQTNAQVRDAIRQELGVLPWTDIMEHRPGWRWDETTGCLRCPDGQELHLMTVRCGERANGNAAAYFTTKAGTCRDCPLHDACLRSATGKQHKQINVTVPADVGEACGRC